MDALSEILESMRFRGRMYCRVDARAPWGMHAEPSGAATFHAVMTGRAVLRMAPELVPTELGKGDLVVLCHGAGHSIADDVATPTQAMRGVANVHGNRLVGLGGTGARASLVCGGLFAERRDGPPVFSLLPALLHIPGPRAPQAMRDVLALLADEATRDTGSDAVTSRLTEALFVCAVRAWIELAPADGRTWLAAMRDPQIGRALGVIHRRPEEAWTVQKLARAAAMSRSAFAARFAELIGEPPLQYITRWRMYLAARELRETNHAIAAIATKVGYESESSLNKAFKRVLGIAPGAYRSGP